MNSNNTVIDINQARQQSRISAVSDDDIVNVSAFDLPFSYYMSDEARLCCLDLMANPLPGNVGGGDYQAYRERWDEDYYLPRFRCAKDIYPVNIRRRTICGVGVDVVEPLEQPAAYRSKVLINLHGGAFMTGASMGGLIESIPVAHTSQIKVISIDYRQSPGHKFPAATDDFLAVYQALLKEYKPENIGVFGCSAGGLLTAMMASLLIERELPSPGALGIVCAPLGSRMEGDSSHFTLNLLGEGVPASVGEGIGQMIRSVNDVDESDPLISPVASLERLAYFPPTLLATGTRARELSSVLYAHNRMIAAGVDASLRVWDGMWHGFCYDTELPESQELFIALTCFFEKYLGEGE